MSISRSLSLSELASVSGGFEIGSNDHLAYLDDQCQHFDFLSAHAPDKEKYGFHYQSQANSFCKSARWFRDQRGDVDPYARAKARELLK